MNYEVDFLKNYLREYDINASNIRLQLLDRLLTSKDHPTAFNLYEDLLNNIPTLSKTSIYNTLDLFMEKKLIRPIILDETETRFDIETKDHGHFKCHSCGNIYDFDLVKREYSGLNNFKIIDEEVQLYGICNNCQQ